MPNRTNTTPLGKKFTVSKNNITDKKHRFLDLDFEIENPSKEEINDKRKQLGKSLLLLYPLWVKELDFTKTIPLVGFGIAFPEIENEEKVEFAARPLVLDAEESQSDDDNDTENGDE